MREINNPGAILPLEAPVCERIAFWTLKRLNEKPAVLPDLVLSQIEHIRVESKYEVKMGMLPEDREASADQIAELNGFLATALQTLGMTQES